MFTIIIKVLLILPLHCHSTALILLYQTMASVHITERISSFMEVGYTLGFSEIERGLQFKLEGLSDENVIKHLLTVVMESKFCSLTSIVIALYCMLL